MDLISVEEAAKELHVNPQSIRNQAAKDVKAFGFPVVRICKTTIIPREAFYKYLKGEDK